MYKEKMGIWQFGKEVKKMLMFWIGTVIFLLAALAAYWVVWTNKKG